MGPRSVARAGDTMSTAAKVYVHPGCAVRHRSWNALASCRYPGNVWVSGEGPVAIVRWCDDRTRVSLHADRPGAERVLVVLDMLPDGCGWLCDADHDVVDLTEATP